MQEANKILKSKEERDLADSSEVGQIALELSAAASSFLEYVTEQQVKQAKARNQAKGE